MEQWSMPNDLLQGLYRNTSFYYGPKSERQLSPGFAIRLAPANGRIDSRLRPGFDRRPDDSSAIFLVVFVRSFRKK